MITLKQTLAACAFTLAASSFAAAQAERPSIGSVDKLEASADAVYGTDSRALANGASVIFEDRIETGPKARLQSTLRDGTQLTLGADATLIIDEYVYDPNQSGGKMALEIVGGAFLFVGGKIEGETGGNVDIRTPVGTLGVRGTTVWGGAIDGGYGVLVLDGEVKVQTAGGSVVLNAGEATMIYGGAEGNPELPHAWPKEKIDRAVKTISFQ